MPKQRRRAASTQEEESVSTAVEEQAPVAEELTEEQIRARMAELEAQMAAISAQAKAQGINVGRGTREPAEQGSQYKVISAANANARAQHALSNATARAEVTQRAYDEQVQAFLNRHGITELPADLVQRIEASTTKTVQKMDEAREKIREKLRKRPVEGTNVESNGSEPAEAPAEDATEE